MHHAVRLEMRGEMNDDRVMSHSKHYASSSRATPVAKGGGGLTKALSRY
jgi:hypothetical protein